jgi:hypothetical protein
VTAVTVPTTNDEVWLTCVAACLRGGRNAESAVIVADEVVEAWTERFVDEDVCKTQPARPLRRDW